MKKFIAWSCALNIDIRPIFKNILIDTPIPGSIKLKETSLNHKPVNITAEKHQACIAIREVAKELKRKGIL